VKERALRSLTSFRLRIILGYALVVAMLAAAWAWSLFGPLTQAAIDQQRTHLQTIAEVSALTLTDSTATPAATIERIVSRTSLRVTLIAADGTVLADSAQDPSTMQNHATRPEVAAALRGHVGTDTRVSATLGVAQMYVAVPATFDQRRVVLRVSEPLAQVSAIADRGRTTGLLLLAGALIIAFVVALRLASTATRPVVDLRDAAEAMAAGDLTVPIPPAHGELADLAQALTTLRDRMRATIGELEGGQATLRAVLDGLQDAVFVLENDNVTIANRAAGELFKSPFGGWKGVTLSDAGLPASLAAAVRSRLSCEEPCSGEVGPDPEARYYRVTAVPLNPTEAGPRTLIVIAEVTEVRRLDAVRRDFVANASHELKTPAASIQLLADAADSAAEDGDTAQALEFVGQMKAEAGRLRHLVVDLLALSRLETTPEAGSITDMRFAVGNALAGHRAAASAAGLALTADESAVTGQDVYVAADPTDVAVALDNLLANAISYSDAGSVAVRLDADADTVTVEVTDTGAGIAPEHLDRIFERFYRVDGARTRASGGTGLGLSLVRNAVERSGGTVAIESRVGEGTTITIRLPRAR
jgi:two-component system, OmpR family, phosphate regulon sensor histidine kinase PhoR